MPDERTRVRLSCSADRLVIQIELTRSGRPGSDQFSQGALADLPGTVHHHDAGIRQRLSGHQLSMPGEEIRSAAHPATLQQITLT